MGKNDAEQPQARGDVEFRQPAAKLVAERPGDDELEEINKKLQDDDGFPHHCGGA
ncbi:hypothetical protein [Paenibacillus alkalitolerans]|uniref:hypothetical protein n=1 Tax=Paenibacillus alkalitolerans TaxID=2799335 RepID=UPI0018F69D4A|nr:hypothetical protein [Paenibacillus alkalitolerans]